MKALHNVPAGQASWPGPYEEEVMYRHMQNADSDTQQLDRSCANCGATETCLWRKEKGTGKLCCNPCGIHINTHGRPRNPAQPVKRRKMQVMPGTDKGVQQWSCDIAKHDAAHGRWCHVHVDQGVQQMCVDSMGIHIFYCLPMCNIVHALLSILVPTAGSLFLC